MTKRFASHSVEEINVKK